MSPFSEGPKIREAAAKALGLLGGEQAFAALIHAALYTVDRSLSFQEQGVRVAVLEALGKFKNPSNVPVLITYLTNPKCDYREKEAAARALKNIGGDNVCQALLATIRDNGSEPYLVEALSGFYS